MISGSDLGVPQTFGTACQLATSVEARYRPRGFLAYLVTIIPLGPIGFAISPGQTHYTHLAPATGSCDIFKFFEPFAPNYNRKIYAPSWCNTSLDMVQGGHFPAFKVYKEALDGKRPKKWYKNLVKLYVTDLIGSQVQQLTYSTLAIGLGTMPNPNRKWDENFRKDVNGLPMDVTCPETKESPFDMYWGPDINTRHDSLLLGHVVRLRKEIIDKQFWPRTPIQRDANITSTKILLCPGETTTFSLQNPLAGIVYNWSVSSPLLQILSGQGTTQILVQFTGGANVQENAGVSCQGSSACYNISGVRTVWLGKPFIGIVGYKNLNACPCNNFFDVLPSAGQSEYAYAGTLTVTALGQASSVSWATISTNNRINWTDLGNGTISISSNRSGGYLELRYRATNACGITDKIFTFSTGGCLVCGPTGDGMITDNGLLLYPNPVTDKVTAMLPGSSDKENQANISEIRIMDKLGNVIKQDYYGSKSPSEVIDVSGLKLDVYTVMVFDGNRWLAGKLIKK
jgi:hypothetical protein